jgi:hypothetical protein
MAGSRMLISAFLLTMLGCTCCTRTVEPTKGYYGPTEPMATVVQKINQNHQGVPTIWATHYFEADIVDPKTKKATLVNGDGVLMYKRPMGFRLVGTKLGETVFEIASTEEHYWLKLKPQENTMWFGEHKHLGKPCVQSLPIQPNLIMEVLGIGLIDNNFQQMPAPVMRFNPDADCYMFVWVTPVGSPARLAAQREIWYDRTTYLPRQVMLFDPDGRVLLRALLDGHKAVGDAGAKVATSYRLFFPDTRSKILIEIKDLRLEKNGIPTNRGITFPGDKPQDAEVGKVIKLDKDCKD